MHPIISQTLPISGNRILIIGNWSYRNLGDELILIGTIKLLQQQGKKIYIQAYDSAWLEGFLKQFIDISEITFLTEIPKGIRSRAKFIWNEIYRGKLIELWHYARIDACIIGGGEILTEENPCSYWYWIISLIPVLIRKLFVQTHIYLMGGIQIPKKNLNKKLFNFLLSKTAHIFARDMESVDTLKTYGYKNVEFFMDTAYFAWEWSSARSLTSHPYIVVNVNKNGEQFLEEIFADVKTYQEKGYEIFYVAVSKGKQRDYDDKKYYKRLPGKIHILDWEDDFGAFVEKIKGAEIVISTRLHLFLIASFLGIKTKVYPYQSKILKMQQVIKETLGSN